MTKGRLDSACTTVLRKRTKESSSTSISFDPGSFFYCRLGTIESIEVFKGRRNLKFTRNTRRKALCQHAAAAHAHCVFSLG